MFYVCHLPAISVLLPFLVCSGSIRAQATTGGGFHFQDYLTAGLPGLEASWQVTGIRHDTYALEHLLQVEVEKQ